ncbi:MAG: hypothetical protein WBC92_09650 [Terracidiphilus sp.]
MPDSINNQAPLEGSSQPPPPPAAQPVAALPPKSGSSALKIILIIVGIFVGLGILAAGVVGYGIYRVAHAVHSAADGKIAMNLPGGTFSANTTQSVGESDLGIAIYPGATQGKGALHMTIAGKSMVTANYLTADSKDQVIAFYKDKVGPNAQSMMTDNGAEFNVTNGTDSIVLTVMQSPNMNDGKTQITIVHTSGGSSK